MLILTRNVELIFSRLRCFWPFGDHTFHWGQTYRGDLFLYEDHNEFLWVSVSKSSSNLFHATHNMNLATILYCQYGYINYSSAPGSTPLPSFLWTFYFVTKVKQQPSICGKVQAKKYSEFCWKLCLMVLSCCNDLVTPQKQQQSLDYGTFQIHYDPMASKKNPQTKQCPYYHQGKTSHEPCSERARM